MEPSQPDLYKPNKDSQSEEVPLEASSVPSPDIMSDMNNALDKETEATNVFSWVALDSHMESKTFGWYLTLFLIALICSGGFYYLTKDIITSSVIVIAAIFIASYALRKPKELNYLMDKQGFKVKDREYIFGNFKSFSIVNQNNHQSLMLAPLKRFSPYIFLSLDTGNADKVINTVSDILPLEKSDNDLFERFLRFIKL